MGWSPEEFTREMAILQVFANYKYDEYKNFSPGMRFIESLALWLRQFEVEDRKIAYSFFKEKLVFISIEEMEHFVAITYPDIIRPLLMKKMANNLQIPEYNVKKIATSVHFSLYQRQCLFLGLSDGAHIDFFRRCNLELSHEQIYQTYEISDKRSEKMLAELNKSLNSESKRFQSVILLDDFSGSGRSYVRWDDKETKFVGKISTFFEFLFNEAQKDNPLFDFSDFHVYIVLYVATNQAKLYLNEMMNKLIGGRKINFSIHIVHFLRDSFKIKIDENKEFVRLMKSKFNPNIVDDHFLKGAHQQAFLGFDECALPLILSHNTPNNSLPILWYEEKNKNHGLFPRVSRHGDRI